MKFNKSVFGHEITNIADAFMSFDRKGVGSLGAEELVDALRRLGVVIKRPAARKLIQQLDSDNSGRIEYDEFVFALEARRKDLTKKPRRSQRNSRHSIDMDSHSEPRTPRPGTSMSSATSLSAGESKRDAHKTRNDEKKRLRKIKLLLDTLNPNLALQLIAKFREDGGHRADSETSNMTFSHF